MASRKTIVKVVLAAMTSVTVLSGMGPSHAERHITYQCYDLDPSRNVADPEPGRAFDASIKPMSPKKSWVCVKK